MEKKTVVVLFGGQSSEHEVSCVSAANIQANIDDKKYTVVMVGITKEGHWLWVDTAEDITAGSWKTGRISALLSPDAGRQVLYKVSEKGTEAIKIDVVFPALHGLLGEDGTVQGLLELARLPYVGCGVLSSAVCMDKWYTKIIVDTLHIRQAAYVPVMKDEFIHMDQLTARIEQKLGYPVFVKPCNAGSSCGISKAADRVELTAALFKAGGHDRKILVEEAIVGRELECAVLGAGGEGASSGVGEIMAAAEFYDYEAKYHNLGSKTVISPQLPDGVEEEIRKYAGQIFRAVDGEGLARVDFFLETKSGEVVFNEINTLPGFTSISMYPMLWEAEGLKKPELIDKLLTLALKRYEI